MTTHIPGDIKFDEGRVEFAGLREGWVKIALTAPADGSETDTGTDLPSDAIVTDVLLNVTTPESTGTTKTIDVGLLSGESNGDADGFLDGVSVASAGWVKGTLASGGQTLGALLRTDESGSSAFVPEPHIIDTAVSVSYTAGSADFAELEADLYVRYLRAV